IYYLSPNLEQTEYNKIINIKEKENSDKKDLPGTLIKNSNLVKLKNTKSNFEYIGLYNGGKIMQINPFLYKDLFIRYDSLVAFTDNIELYENRSISRSIY